MTETNVGTRIATLRKERDITQIQLAEALGVSDKTVSKWETGGCYPDITLIPKLADFFGVSTDYVLRGTPRKTEKLLVFPAYGRENGLSVDSVNKEYLDNGWEVKDIRLQGEEDPAIAIVLKKTVYD